MTQRPRVLTVNILRYETDASPPGHQQSLLTPAGAPVPFDSGSSSEATKRARDNTKKAKTGQAHQVALLGGLVTDAAAAAPHNR